MSCPFHTFRIAGYAWFSFHTDRAPGVTSALYDAEGEMTALGRYYASVTRDKPDGDQRISIDKGVKKRKGKKLKDDKKEKPKL